MNADKSTQPYFSIIIPIRNEYKRLHYCLPSLLGQNFANFEIILMEDPATSDETASYVSTLHDARLSYVVHDHGLKVPAKRNLGAKQARGSYLYFIDADMEFPGGVLQGLHDEIELHKAELVFVAERTPGPEWAARMKDLEKQIIQHYPALAAARLYKRDLFEHMGGYKDDLIVGEEVDLSDRAVDSGATYIVSNVSVNHYEISESLWNHFRKKFKYGMSVGSYFTAKDEQKKHDTQTSVKHDTANARAGTSRMIYFTSPKTWANPIIGIQFIFFKFSEMACLALGLMYSKLTRRNVINTR